MDIDSAANILPLLFCKTEQNMKSKTQTWPYIRFAKAEQKWIVDARTKHGGSRRFFATKIEAQTFAQQCRVARVNSGVSAFGNVELARFGKTVQDAISFYLAHLRQQEKSVPVSAAIAELLELKRAAQKSERYLYDLRLRLGRFAQTYAEKSVAAITSKELDQWLIGLGRAPETRNTFRRVLGTLFSFCEKRGYRLDNPIKNTERAESVDKPAGILTPAQTSALLNACEADLLPYVAISLFAGLRSAEVQRLSWAEVDLVGGHIEVTAAKSKTKRRRLVPISDNLAKWLRPVAHDEGPITPDGIRYRLENARKRAGFKGWPPNAMRHSFGSYRLAICADVARVSLEMGNSPEMVFAHYRELVRPKEAEEYWAITPIERNVMNMAA